jgi:hypothetical protein
VNEKLRLQKTAAYLPNFESDLEWDVLPGELEHDTGELYLQFVQSLTVQDEAVIALLAEAHSAGISLFRWEGANSLLAALDPSNRVKALQYLSECQSYAESFAAAATGIDLTLLPRPSAPVLLSVLSCFPASVGVHGALLALDAVCVALQRSLGCPPDWLDWWFGELFAAEAVCSDRTSFAVLPRFRGLGEFLAYAPATRMREAALVQILSDDFDLLDALEVLRGREFEITFVLLKVKEDGAYIETVLPLLGESPDGERESAGGEGCAVIPVHLLSSMTEREPYPGLSGTDTLVLPVIVQQCDGVPTCLLQRHALDFFFPFPDTDDTGSGDNEPASTEN